MPLRWFSSYSLAKAGSVPFRRVISNCSGVRSLRHSLSDLTMRPTVTNPWFWPSSEYSTTIIAPESEDAAWDFEFSGQPLVAISHRIAAGTAAVRPSIDLLLIGFIAAPFYAADLKRRAVGGSC